MANPVGTVTSSRLNLRRDPSLDHPSIVSLPRHTPVEVLGREGGWYRVRFGGQVGYVSAAYLAVDAPAPPARRTGRVTASTLNVRAGTSTTHSVVGRLPEAALLEILGEEGGWLHVRAAGVEGYVSARYVADADAAPPPTVGAAPRPTAPGFLLARPELQAIPLEPAARVAVTPGMAAPARTAARSWNGFGGLLGAVGGTLGMPVPAAVSVLCVESGGAGFKDQRMIIRFENHVFFNYWGKKDPARFARHFSFGAQRKWTEHRFRAREEDPWEDFHGDQAREWTVFEFARGLDEAAAMSSISMGAPQIMGFNHKRIGYGSVQEMFSAFSRDARFQILGMFDFVRGDPAMLEALRRGDFETFASRYNGSGQSARYGALIRQHSEACAQLLAQAPSPGG